MTPAIWLFNLESFAAKNITGNEAANSQPMWHGSTLYFLSDRDKNRRGDNLGGETKKKKIPQITTFDGFCNQFPNIRPGPIGFENTGAPPPALTAPPQQFSTSTILV